MQSNQVVEEKKPDQDEDLSYLSDEELQKILWTVFTTNNSCKQITQLKRKNLDKVMQSFQGILDSHNPELDLEGQFNTFFHFDSSNILTELEIKTFRRLNTKSALLAILKAKRDEQLKIFERIDQNTRELHHLKSLAGAFVENDCLNNYLDFFLFITKKTQSKSKKETIEFTSNYTTQPPDVLRLIQGNPDYYITKNDTTQKNQKRKIIIHLPFVANYVLDGTFDYKIEIMDMLNLSDLFDLYICIGGKIVSYSREHRKPDLISTSDIKKILSDSNENVDDYYILDHAEFTNNFYGWEGEKKTKFPPYLNLSDTRNIQLYSNAIELNVYLDSLKCDKLSCALKSFTHLETLNIKLNENIYGLLILKESEKLKNISFYGSGYSDGNQCVYSLDLNLDHAKNLHYISFKDISLINFLDLTKLNQLKQVKFIGEISIEKDILFSQSRVSSLTFDFSECKLSDQIALKIIDLRRRNANVILTKDQEESLNKILEEKPSIKNLPEEQKPTYTENVYDTKPSPMQESKEGKKKSHQTIQLINENGDIPPSKYRKKMFNGITIQQGKILFTPCLLDMEQSEPVDLSEKKQKGSFLGKISLSTEQDFWMPLPSLSLEDELILIDQNKQALERKGLQLKIRYSNETRQYFVKLSKTHVDVPDSEIDLCYAMSPTKKQPSYQNKIPVSAQLPDDLRNAISILQTRKPMLKKIFEAETVELKIQGIIEYCSLFVDTNIINLRGEEKEINKILSKENISNPDVHEFMAHLCLQDGSCHERSRVFMALAMYFNIPVRVNRNDMHEYVEYFDGKKWNINNTLGGSEADLTTTNAWGNSKKQLAPTPKISLDTTSKAPLAPTSNVPLSLDEKVEEDIHEFDSKFNPSERILDDLGGFHFTYWYLELISLPGFPPLLEYTNESQALDFHSSIMQLPGHVVGENYFYIQHPDDFDRLLRSIQVSHNECHPIEGPLLKLLNSSKPGTLLINWSNFNEADIASYKSILEKKAPTLQGHKIPSNVKIINISRPDTKACSSFKSRTQNVLWPRRLDIKPGLSIQTHPSADPSCVDLYESENWLSRLIGRQKITPDGFVFHPGALVEAIQQGKDAIYLTGLPYSSRSFQNFFERLKRERKFYANGELYVLPQNFTLHLSPNPENDPTPLPAFDPAAGSDVPFFYVNNQNFDSLFEQFTIHPNKKAEQREGLLKEMPEHSVIVLTDELTQGEMRRLKKEIRPNIQLKVLSRSSVNQTALSDKPLNQSSVILTSDVNGAERQLSEKAAYSIPISETTQFSDLFETVKITRKEEKSGITLEFDHQYFKLYDSLKNGKTVILKGDISSELYHQLETLFANPPYLKINGKREDIPGKLILITPPKKDYLNLFDSAGEQYTHQFDWDKIPAYLMSEMKIDHEKALEFKNKIREFCIAAKRIPHNGKTTPPEFILTEERVLDIALAMARRPDKNPVKRNVLQNYTEDKSSYDALNQLSKKYLYDKKPKTKTNETLEAKQTRLIHEVLEYSPFVELRGTPGTGKTHFIKYMLPKNAVFWGEKEILEWLKPSPTGEIKYLLLDEANMKEPGYWDFLKSLKSGKIYYKGKWYPDDPALFTSCHKIIFTGNPENYPRRHYHSFLQEVPKIYFKSYTDEYLVDRIIFPALCDCPYHDALKMQIAQCIVAVYKHTKSELPFESLSIRDIRSVLDHFVYPAIPCVTDAMMCAHLACRQAFAGLFKDETSRKKFLAYLSETFHCECALLKEYPNTKDPYYYLPDSQKFLWNTINQCIERGGLLPEEGARRAILVEGASGVGKSEMMLQAVSNQGFVHHTMYDKNCPNQKIYFHLSMGSDSVSEELLKAYKLSKTHQVVLILDELNLFKPKDEAILTAILEGRSFEKEKHKEKHKEKNEEKSDEKNKKKKRNLVVLASQNSQLEGGRLPLSHASLNRFDRFHDEVLTRHDLLDICRQTGKFSDNIDDPRAQRFVDHFLQQNKKYPSKINTRTFFDELKLLNVTSKTREFLEAFEGTAYTLIGQAYPFSANEERAKAIEKIIKLKEFVLARGLNGSGEKQCRDFLEEHIKMVEKREKKINEIQLLLKQMPSTLSGDAKKMVADFDDRERTTDELDICIGLFQSILTEAKKSASKKTTTFHFGFLSKGPSEPANTSSVQEPQHVREQKKKT